LNTDPSESLPDVTRDGGVGLRTVKETEDMAASKCSGE
jgi:hypothetical protein